METENEEASGTMINCLRCRQCKPLPDTDFAREIQPPIWCDKAGEKRICIFSGCGLAVPETRYQNGNRGRKTNPNGDKTRDASEVELLFLGAHYPTLAWQQLTRLTGRTRQTLNTIARYHHLPVRKVTPQKQRECSARARDARIQRGMHLTPEQSKLVHEYYFSGRWPYRGGHHSQEHRARNQALREQIVEAVAAIGPRWRWTTLVRHVQYLSPAYQRQQANRRKRRREQCRQQRLERGGVRPRRTV